jgi:hypothetical protein
VEKKGRALTVTVAGVALGAVLSGSSQWVGTQLAVMADAGVTVSDVLLQCLPE